MNIENLLGILIIIKKLIILFLRLNFQVMKNVKFLVHHWEDLQVQHKFVILSLFMTEYYI